MPSTGSAADLIAPAGYSYQLTGYGPLTKDGAEQSEKDLQKAELVSLPIAALVLDPRLRLDRRRRDAVAGRGPRHPEHDGPHLHRRPAGRDEHLRAQHRDDAGPGAGHRLLAVHRQPLPRGAAPRHGPSARPSSAPSPPPARRSMFSGIAVAIGLSGLLLFEAPGHPLHRHRRLARRHQLGLLRPDLPAGGPRHAGPTRERAVAGAVSEAVPADAHRTEPYAARTSRWEHVALWVMRHPIQVIDPDAGLPAHRSASRSRTWSRACPGAEVYPPGVESRDAYVALQTEFAPGETTPIVILADVDGSPDGRRRRSRRITDYSAELDRDRRHRPGRGAVRRSPTRRPACRSRPSRSPRSTRSRTGQRPRRARRPARAVRPRQHGPARGDQPARRRRARPPRT